MAKNDLMWWGLGLGGVAVLLWWQKDAVGQAVTDVSDILSGYDAIDELQPQLISDLNANGLGDPAYLQAMLAILHNETGGHRGPWLGDTSLPGGPSIGPGQVYRATAKSLRLWSPPAGQDERAAYTALGQDLDWATTTGVTWAVLVFKAKLAAAGGDISTAIRMYNGAGPQAESYAAKAIAWAQSLWGDTALQTAV